MFRAQDTHTYTGQLEDDVVIKLWKKVGFKKPSKFVRFQENPGNFCIRREIPEFAERYVKKFHFEMFIRYGK